MGYQRPPIRGSAGACRLSAIYGFGDFELDAARFELRRHGQRVNVQPKVLRLLCLLVAERHRAISDSELLTTLWPDEQVSRASIKRAILGARRALEQHEQGCIRTVRGHGYQFMWPVRVSAAPGAPAASASAQGAGEPAGAARFVGREGLLSELDAELHAALAGRGRCVLLRGEAGIGKTSVLHELAERATALGAHAWFGRCMELDGAPAFWPLAQIMRELARGRSAAELSALLGPGAPDVADAFPELRQRLPDLPGAPALHSAPARFRLFEGVAGALMRVAEQRPLVLLLDDLQRADQPSLRLVLFLVQRLEGSRVLIVGTARATHRREAGVSELLAALARESAARCIELHGFCPAEIATYLQQRSGATVPEPVITQLYERTAGNPLFLAALTRSLSGDAPSWDQLVRLPPGHDLRSAIERHLEALSAGCCSVLTRAAVLGRDFSEGLLLELSSEPREELIASLSEANSAGVIQASSSGVGQHRFTHALIRDVLYERTPRLERERRHARIALALEARGASYDDAQLAELAEHFMLAASTHDAGRALHYARLAAERAIQRLAYEEAAVQLGRALQILELGPPDRRLRTQLLLDRGEALALGPEPDAARAGLLEAAALAAQLGETDLLVRAASLLARPRESGSVDPRKIAVLRQALAVLPESDPRTPSLRALLAKALSYTDEHATRTELALSALALTRQLESPAVRAESLLACHEALSHPEQLAQRLQIAEELTQLAHLHASTRTMTAAATACFQNAVERGNLADMDASIATLEALARQLRDPVATWYAKSFRSTRVMVDGRFDLAEQFAIEAFQLGKLVGEDLAHHQYYTQVIALHRLRGRMAEAETMARDVSLRYPALAGWRAVVACIDADLGRKERARETLMQLIADDLMALRRDPYLLSALCPTANLCGRVGDAEIAKPLYRALLPYEDLHGNLSLAGGTYGPISLPLARLAMCMRDAKAAARHCERAIDTAALMPSPFFLMQGQLSYAFLLAHLGPGVRDKAIEHLRSAWRLANASELHAISAQCEVVAKQLQVTER